jgi:hypothetical protein
MTSLRSVGFVIENEWYWRITEGATSLDARSAVRDFLAPLVRNAPACKLEDIAPDGDRAVRFRIAERRFEIALVAAADRIAINGLVGDLNRAFATAELDLVFALVVPNRFELRGVLLSEQDVAALSGDQVVLIPSTRPSWRATPYR